MHDDLRDAFRRVDPPAGFAERVIQRASGSTSLPSAEIEARSGICRILPSASAASPVINRPCQKRAGFDLAWVVALWSLTVFPVVAQDPALNALVRAYPDFLASHDGRVLIWKDGTRMSVSDGRSDKSFQEKLLNPSILDQLSIPYGHTTRPTG